MRCFSVKKRNPIGGYIQIGLLLIFFAGMGLGFSRALKSSLSQEKQIVSKAVARSITQCYAQEGIYPPDIDYLIKQYGLTYNQKRFFIDYEYIGGNLRPQVTIIERN